MHRPTMDILAPDDRGYRPPHPERPVGVECRDRSGAGRTARAAWRRRSPIWRPTDGVAVTKLVCAPSLCFDAGDKHFQLGLGQRGLAGAFDRLDTFLESF